MKKINIYIFLICFFFLISANTFAQYNSFMSISFGGSIPQGDFGDTDPNNESAGYALTGFFLSFDGAYMFVPYVGIGGSLSFANNSINTVAVRDQIKQYIEEYYPDLELPEDSQISYDFGFWNNICIMAGPYFALPVGRITFDIRGVAGMNIILPPKTQMNFYIPPDEEFRSYREGQQTVAFGYKIGGGIRYESKSSYVFRLMADYSYTKTTISVTDELPEYITPNNNETRQYEQPIGSILVGLGIGYHF